MSSNGDEDDDQDEMDLDVASDDEELDAAARISTMSSGKIGAPGNKKPETEEEKRKNFLERNRQGLLLSLFGLLLYETWCLTLPSNILRSANLSQKSR